MREAAQHARSRTVSRRGFLLGAATGVAAFAFAGTKQTAHARSSEATPSLSGIRALVPSTLRSVASDQDDRRWCYRCESLWFGGQRAHGICAASEAHGPVAGDAFGLPAI